MGGSVSMWARWWECVHVGKVYVHVVQLIGGVVCVHVGEVGRGLAYVQMCEVGWSASMW